MIWMPYDNEIMESLPAYCLRGQQIWQAVVPLICFNIVQWHQPDRIFRQFGQRQHIPIPPRQNRALERTDLRSGVGNWGLHHQEWIAIWDDRINTVRVADVHDTRPQYHSQYMEWYRRVTRRYLSHQGGLFHAMKDAVERIKLTDDVNTIHHINQTMFDALAEEERIIMGPPPEPEHIPEHHPHAHGPSQQRNRRRRSSNVNQRQRANTSTLLHPIEFHIGQSSRDAMGQQDVTDDEPGFHPEASTTFEFGISSGSQHLGVAQDTYTQTQFPASQFGSHSDQFPSGIFQAQPYAGSSSAFTAWSNPQWGGFSVQPTPFSGAIFTPTEMSAPAFGQSSAYPGGAPAFGQLSAYPGGTLPGGTFAHSPVPFQMEQQHDDTDDDNTENPVIEPVVVQPRRAPARDRRPPPCGTGGDRCHIPHLQRGRGGRGRH